jgi:hypothetical protein
MKTGNCLTSPIQTNLETARTKQRKQADNMLKSTAMSYGEVEVGTTVRIPVPEDLHSGLPDLPYFRYFSRFFFAL